MAKNGIKTQIEQELTAFLEFWFFVTFCHLDIHLVLGQFLVNLDYPKSALWTNSDNLSGGTEEIEDIYIFW